MGDNISRCSTFAESAPASITVGVIGFGYWGPNHVRVLSREPNVEVVVIDPDPAQRARAEELLPRVRTEPSLAEVTGPLDAVVVCSPPATHLAVTREAFDRGAHALVEKPLALRLDEAEAMVAAAAASGRVLMTGHIYDFHAATTWMEEQGRNGRYGQIRYLDAARLAVGGYRSDANVMWDMAPHDLCLMRRVMGCWPTTVMAWAVDHSHLGVPDLAHLRLGFPDTDAVGYIRVSWLNPEKVRRFTVVGDETMVVFDDAADPNRPLQMIRTGATNTLGEGARHPLPGAYPAELIESPAIDLVEPLAAELRHFLHSVRTGAPPSLASGVEGLQVVRILEAADRSARLGEAVAIPEVGPSEAVLAR